MRKYPVFIKLLFGVMLLCAPSVAHADDAEVLPDFVNTQIHAPLKMVGEGNYRKVGFKIYHASLWAPNGAWDAAKPFALKITYARSLSKDTVLDALMDDIREQKVADDATMEKWKTELNASLPAVEDGDTIVALSIPGKKSLLYFKGKNIGSIDDKVFSTAFFNIWLGDTANEDLRKKLLGQPD